MKKINIAIDGPSAAGKSTVAKALSADLGYIYVDTGALYRVIGLAATKRGIDTTNSELIAGILPSITVKLGYEDKVQKVYLDSVDVSEEIRRPEMSMAASNVSAHKEVRAYLLELQRSLAAEGGIVMDGRDIGTVVLPNAELKIFLTASPEIRAKRRLAEFTEKGHTVEYDALLEEIKQRDYNDSNRKEAPLKQADDGVLLDSTDLALEEVVAFIHNIVRERS